MFQLLSLLQLLTSTSADIDWRSKLIMHPRVTTKNQQNKLAVLL